MTGHGNVVFSQQEAENLENYLLGGGFLHIDDDGPYIRPEMKKVFPELDWIELPYTHPIYQQNSASTTVYLNYTSDAKSPQGFGLVHEERLVCFYTRM